jgi:hypothetical protein
MSTDFRILDPNTLEDTPIRFDELFDGRLRRWGVREYRERCFLNDDSGCAGLEVWEHHEREGFIGTLTCAWMSAGTVRGILDAITREFGGQAFSEYQPQFWGCGTDVEWHWAQEEFNQRCHEDVEAAGRNLVRFLQGEEVEFTQPRLRGEAEAARGLVLKDPALLAPERIAELRERAGWVAHARGLAAVRAAAEKGADALEAVMAAIRWEAPEAVARAATDAPDDYRDLPF